MDNPLRHVPHVNTEITLKDPLEGAYFIRTGHEPSEPQLPELLSFAFAHRGISASPEDIAAAFVEHRSIPDADADRKYEARRHLVRHDAGIGDVFLPYDGKQARVHVAVPNRSPVDILIPASVLENDRHRDANATKAILDATASVTRKDRTTIEWTDIRSVPEFGISVPDGPGPADLAIEAPDPYVASLAAYKASITLTAQEIERIREYVSGATDMEVDLAVCKSVRFPDGTSMEFAVRKPVRCAEKPFCQVRLNAPNGSAIGCTKGDEEPCRDWTFEHAAVTYTLSVKPDPSDSAGGDWKKTVFFVMEDTVLDPLFTQPDDGVSAAVPRDKPGRPAWDSDTMVRCGAVLPLKAFAVRLKAMGHRPVLLEYSTSDGERRAKTDWLKDMHLFPAVFPDLVHMPSDDPVAYIKNQSACFSLDAARSCLVCADRKALARARDAGILPVHVLNAVTGTGDMLLAPDVRDKQD